MNTKNIVLIGLTGCGKTTIGKLLSKEINYDFIDMDDFIVEDTGKTIPELFEVSEDYFRKCESEICKKLCNKKCTVIASGGGVVKNKENLECFNDNSIIIFVDRPVKNIIEDIEVENRPLLEDGKSILYKLYDERYELYQSQCHYKIDNNNNSLECIVENIVNLVRKIGTED